VSIISFVGTISFFLGDGGVEGDSPLEVFATWGDTNEKVPRASPKKMG